MGKHAENKIPMNAIKKNVQMRTVFNFAQNRECIEKCGFEALVRKKWFYVRIALIDYVTFCVLLKN